MKTLMVMIMIMMRMRTTMLLHCLVWILKILSAINFVETMTLFYGNLVEENFVQILVPFLFKEEFLYG